MMDQRTVLRERTLRFILDEVITEDQASLLVQQVASRLSEIEQFMYVHQLDAAEFRRMPEEPDELDPLAQVKHDLEALIHQIDSVTIIRDAVYRRKNKDEGE